MTSTDPADTARPDELPFHLRGNYAPVTNEVTSFDLAVEGALPPELTGLYLRNGPNPRSGRSGHWFTGDGMLHGIRLEAGRAAWYRNRWIRTRAFTDPEARLLGDDGSVDRTVGVNNTHIVGHAGRLLALVESSFPCEVTPELDTIGVHDFDGGLTSAMTAHPKVCPRTGELLFFGYGFFPPYLTYNRVSATGQLVQTEVIDVPGPTMIHDFTITEHYAVFLDLPLVFDLDLALQGTMPYRWDDGYGARVGVMPRTGSSADVRWFEVEPCYVFHVLNSYESDDGLIVDVARYPELWRRDSSGFTNDATLHRWTFDLASGTVQERALDDRPIEFPRLRDDLTGLPNRFGYAVATFQRAAGTSAPGPGEGPGHNSLVAYDLRDGTSASHDFGHEQIPGEAVFAPAPGVADEDGGWLLSFVYDKPTGTSRLVVLDAADLSRAPVASVALPQRVPLGFHGSWLAD